MASFESTLYSLQSKLIAAFALLTLASLVVAASVFVDLGLVPCQVQDGKLVNLFGPGAGEARFD